MGFNFNYGVYHASDVITRTGNKGGGATLSGYTIHNAAMSLIRDQWSLTLYADNLTDKYVESGVRSTARNIQTVSDINGGPVVQRSYFNNVLPPRQIGLRMTWDFNG